MLRTASLIAIVLLLTAAGCGGSSSSSSGGAGTPHSVLDVSKAFYQAELAFTSVVTSNPYVAGQQVYLPLSLNQSDLSLKVVAQLTGSLTSTRNGWIAWVFDTDADAQKALKQVPLQKWGTGSARIDRVVKGNVIIVASGFTGLEKKRLDNALAKL